MKIQHKFLFKYIIFLFLIFSISCQNCLMKEHNFYLIPLIKENNSNNLYGLHKYDYILILETDPLSENDNYHMVFEVTFPINVNIELSTEIIYKFESTRKFCIKDLTKKSVGRQSNIQGKLSEYNSEIQILEKIWIKIEEVKLYRDVPSNEKKDNIFFLLSEFYEKEKNKKKYILMKKMNNSGEKQFYQIVRVNIDNENGNVDCLNDENQFKIGTEINIRQIDSDEDSILREGLEYDAFIEKKPITINNIGNLICLIYENKEYVNKCFSSNSNTKNNNKINKNNFITNDNKIDNNDYNNIKKTYLRSSLNQFDI